MFIELVIQNQFFSYSLEEFAQIFNIHCEGACVFTDKWSLDELAYGVPTNGPYQTNPPSPDDIISSIRIDREGQVTRICHEEEINVYDHQILTREIVPTLKPLEEIIRENVFCLRDSHHLHHLHNHLLHFSSTYMASTQASSSNPSKKIKLTIIQPRQLFVDLFSKEYDTTTPSPITKSSSLFLPNAPSKTPSTKDTSSTFCTTSFSFESKSQSLPPTSNDIPFPQSSNPFLDNIMDAPPRPLNPIPLQSHHSLDITLSLSPITPLDHILDTPSPPSLQPQPQPTLMGHPIYFNTLDYHRVNYHCCFQNQNLIFSLKDEMDLMFAHIEYLLTFAIASPSSPHP
nr:hypothetical protein [Tanacetum cinerariifolium]